MSDYSAACFDLDGTLIDTEPVHVRAETLCLAALGISASSLRHERTFGKGFEAGIKSLSDTYELDYELVLGTYMPLWKSGLRGELTTLPGAVDILSWLTEHRVPMALVTSCGRAYVELVDSILGLLAGFSQVITSDDVVDLKPAPDPYLKAAADLGCAPTSCVGFEDSGSGVSALNQAMMLSVAVHPDHPSRPELQDANVKITSLAEAIPLLATWFD
jgi:beta-phosphoglucomutase-like phosphatase (HAD superfamily)